MQFLIKKLIIDDFVFSRRVVGPALGLGWTEPVLNYKDSFLID